MESGPPNGITGKGEECLLPGNAIGSSNGRVEGAKRPFAQSCNEVEFVDIRARTLACTWNEHGDFVPSLPAILETRRAGICFTVQ
jgi:hypothetical protein